ncbi:hypothetical protein [Mycolicibacterium sp. CBMA 226]|uniref:hypothetical protein n=1 Tax=Mycolicibacterium sp. CBMA 226 TaxID=2606611 RepID=UPI0012DE58A0|nr:hypothetical protein [Mycolicibacterium sp. CBMA 226]
MTPDDGAHPAVKSAVWLPHRGEHYRIDDVSFLPRPYQQSIPSWIAGYPGTPGP